MSVNKCVIKTRDEQTIENIMKRAINHLSNVCMHCSHFRAFYTELISKSLSFVLILLHFLLIWFHFILMLHILLVYFHLSSPFWAFFLICCIAHILYSPPPPVTLPYPSPPLHISVEGVSCSHLICVSCWWSRPAKATDAHRSPKQKLYPQILYSVSASLFCPS